MEQGQLSCTLSGVLPEPRSIKELIKPVHEEKCKSKTLSTKSTSTYYHFWDPNATSNLLSARSSANRSSIGLLYSEFYNLVTCGTVPCLQASWPINEPCLLETCACISGLAFSCMPQGPKSEKLRRRLNTPRIN